MYALERLFATSGHAGTELTNFNSLLGVSAKTLQEYQYAARQAGVSNQEVEGSFKALQSAMTKTLMGEGAPKGLARVALLTGSITPEDIDRFAKQPQLLLQRLQQYARKETNAGLRREVLNSFGVGEGVQSALIRNAFNPGALSKAPAYSEKEIKALDRANIAWSNLGNNIEMAVGHFNAKHGGQLVTDISKITDEVLKLVEAFTKMAEKIKLFEAIGKVFEGWTLIFDAITASVDGTNEALGKGGAEGTAPSTPGDKTGQSMSLSKGYIALEKFFTEGLPKAWENLGKSGVQGVGDPALKDVLTGANLKKSNPSLGVLGLDVWKHSKGAWDKMENSGVGDPAIKAMLDRERSNVVPFPESKSVAPNAPAAATPGGGAPIQNFNVDQTLNFQHDGKDHQRAANDMKRAVKDAYRQMPAQAQGS